MVVVTDPDEHGVRKHHREGHGEEDRADRQGGAERAMARMHGQPTEKPYSYHETAMVFWMAIARLFLSSFNPGMDRLKVPNLFLGCYRARESMILEHYRPRALQSWEARVSWAEPDLEPLAVPLPASSDHGSARSTSDSVYG